jgi:hypothetical protein
MGGHLYLFLLRKDSSGDEFLWEISGDAKIENRVGSYLSKFEVDPLKDDINLHSQPYLFTANFFLPHEGY